MKKEMKDLARYRIIRAQNTFKEGNALFEKSFFPGAVNRFYYAAFYASRALLAIKGLDSSKYSGAIALFHEHFVRTGIVDKEKSKALSRSFEQRQDSDYEDFAEVNKQEAESLKLGVEAFIQECQRVLNEA